MNKYKLRLIFMLIIQLVLIVINKLFGIDFKQESFFTLSNWTYWLAIGWSLALALYALRLSCPHCGAKQVFRGFSAFDLRWPQDKCHRCGAEIK